MKRRRRPTQRIRPYTVTRYSTLADETPDLSAAELAARGLVKLARNIDLEKIAGRLR